MANESISRAARVLKNNPQMKSLAEFWVAFGRSDLAVYTRYEQLEWSPRLQSVLHFAAAKIASRVEPPPAKPKPKRIEAFVLEPLERVYINTKLVDRSTGEFTLYHLHPTKGWRRSKIDASEKKHACEEKRFPLLREWPKGRVRSAA